jgi:hypothetical protein
VYELEYALQQSGCAMLVMAPQFGHPIPKCLYAGAS